MAESDSESSTYEDAVSDNEQLCSVQSNSIGSELLRAQTDEDFLTDPKNTPDCSDSEKTREWSENGKVDGAEPNDFAAEGPISGEEDSANVVSAEEGATNSQLLEEPSPDAAPITNPANDSDRWQQQFSSRFPESSIMTDDVECEASQDVPKQKVAEELAVDLESLKLEEESLSEEELQKRQANARELKEEANSLYRNCEYTNAVTAYTEALRSCPVRYTDDRAILHSNRAAALLAQERLAPAIEDCSTAVELNPAYAKAYRRRAELYEKSDKLDEALEDYKTLLQLEPSNRLAREACHRLPDQIKERNEKLKDEMLGKLKDLGNMVLKPFGLSTNNFQMVQDPNTGGYSINFKQNSDAS